MIRTWGSRNEFRPSDGMECRARSGDLTEGGKAAPARAAEEPTEKKKNIVQQFLIYEYDDSWFLPFLLSPVRDFPGGALMVAVAAR